MRKRILILIVIFFIAFSSKSASANAIPTKPYEVNKQVTVERMKLVNCKDCKIIQHIREENRIEKDIITIKHKRELDELKQKLDITARLLESELR